MKRFAKTIKNTLLALAGGLMLVGGVQARDQLYWSVDVAAPVAYGGAVRSSWSNSPRVQVVQAPVYVQAPAPVYIERPWYPHRAGFRPYPVVIVSHHGRHHHGRPHHGWHGHGGDHGSHHRDHEHGHGHGHDRD